MRSLWIFWFCIWPFFCSGGDAFETEEESLFLRRISEFWQEGEFQIAKNQIEEFIAEYPGSRYTDPLCAALGDLYLREKNATQALSHYAKVQSPEQASKVFLSRMQCLYEMQWYATLADECESYLQKCDASADPSQRLHATYFLAIALYQQCLNASKEPDTLAQLAERAKPYFQTLLESELSGEVAQSFAHLCCILKDFQKASRIYQDLGEGMTQADPSASEELLFQAALVRAEYDKESALESFDAIAKKGGKKGKEAAYNRLVLAFDTGRYAELALAKEAIFAEMPEEKTDMAHLFFGRSLLSLKKYPEAVEELKAFLSGAEPQSEAFYPALLSLLEAAYEAGDLAGLDFAIEKLPLLKELEVQKELPKALFSRAQVLKRSQNLEKAREQLEKLVERFPHFNQRAQALFELSHLNFQQKIWDSSRRWAHLFVSEFPLHELAPFAWRYLATSSSELAAASSDRAAKEQLARDLESLLAYKDYFPAAEMAEWQFLYVKTLIQLGKQEAAASLLEGFLDAKNETSALKGTKEANAWLLLALCYRDGSHDLEKFCKTAEYALGKNPDVIDQSQIHLFLFNAYLQRSSNDPELLKQGADHLYAAFQKKAPIQAQNLHWLAEFYFSQFLESKSNAPLAEKTAGLFEHLLQPADFLLSEKTLPLERSVYHLAQLYDSLGWHDREISLLEKIADGYRNSPQLKSDCKNEILLQLGSAYFHKGEKEKALSLFDTVAGSNGTLRTSAAASAALYRAKLHLAALENPNLDPKEGDALAIQISTELKNLVLQKRLANEPSHLEAALDYIDFQTRFEKEPFEKRLSLLQKTKADFERSDDLLSKDYHAARTHLPQKNRIYERYLQLIEADLLLTRARLATDPELQKELQANGKGLLLKLIDEKAHPLLVERAQKRLNSVR